MHIRKEVHTRTIRLLLFVFYVSLCCDTLVHLANSHYKNLYELDREKLNSRQGDWTKTYEKSRNLIHLMQNVSATGYTVTKEIAVVLR